MSLSASPFPLGKKVATYLRNSGGDDQDLSVEQQEAVVTKYCQDNHLQLTRVLKISLNLPPQLLVEQIHGDGSLLSSENTRT